MTIGVPNRFVDHGSRNILLEEIGLDSMTLFEKIYNFSRKSNDKKS
jgi:1-deoxy-D-xylulose-5-phosphate synthase